MSHQPEDYTVQWQEVLIVFISHLHSAEKTVSTCDSANIDFTRRAGSRNDLFVVPLSSTWTKAKLKIGLTVDPRGLDHGTASCFVHTYLHCLQQIVQLIQLNIVPQIHITTYDLDVSTRLTKMSPHMNVRKCLQQQCKLVSPLQQPIQAGEFKNKRTWKGAAAQNP